MTTLRDSPSGKIVEFGQSTSDISNASTHVSGATASDALESLETRIASFTRTRVFDRFIGGRDKTGAGASLVGAFGDNNWSIFGSGAGNFALRLAGTSTRYGQYAISSLTSVISGFVLSGTNAVSTGTGLLASQVVSASWVGATNLSAGLNGKYRFGLGSTANGANFGSDGIFFEVDREIGTFWRCIARRGGGQSTITTSVSAPNGTYFTLAFSRQASGAFAFTINGTSVGSITSSLIPAGRMFAGCQVEATVNSGQDIAIDTFDMEYLRAA